MSEDDSGIVLRPSKDLPAQHSGLTEERWAAFDLDRQLLMIGNEMNRARKLMAPEARDHLSGCYERALRLTDLTIRVNPRRALRRELLRWRDLVARLYLADRPDPATHDAVFRCLLQLTPEAAKQIPLLLR